MNKFSESISLSKSDGPASDISTSSNHMPLLSFLVEWLIFATTVLVEVCIFKKEDFAFWYCVVIKKHFVSAIFFKRDAFKNNKIKLLVIIFIMQKSILKVLKTVNFQRQTPVPAPSNNML